MIHTSTFWRNHFQENLTHQRINWELEPILKDEERQEILYSLKAWQLGETSDGSQLLRAAEQYARKINDPNYVEAIRYFIKEEQKHGNNLGRYLDLIGEQRAKSDWGDTLFRKVRHLNTSMELWTLTVIIVESAAQVFYQCLHDATECNLLRAICADILVDEAHHIKFQNERFYTIFESKGFYRRAISLVLYGALFFGTIHAVWFGHRKVFKAGGVDFGDFMRQMCYKFFGTIRFLHRKEKRMTAQAIAQS